MNVIFLEIAMCIIFLFGNSMHTLLLAYQHVQVSKKFNGYGAWMAAFWVPELVRTTFQLVAFAICLPWLAQIDYHANFHGVALDLKFNMGWAWMGGFMSDVIMAILAQKLASKYPQFQFLVAQIPSQVEIDASDPSIKPEVK